MPVLALGLALLTLIGPAVMMPLDADPIPQTVMVHDRKGRPIGPLYPGHDHRHTPLHGIPRVLRHAVIAAEDARFRDHHGVDPLAIARAAWANLRGEPLQGASTLTQQLAKNRYLDTERSLVRKAREAVIALRMDWHHTKDELLEMYLNEVYLGHGLFGVGAASRAYFGKEPLDLELHHAATLAGIIPAPSELSPWVAPEQALARRNRVLDRMTELELITPGRAAAAKAAPLEVRPRQVRHRQAGHFIDYMGAEVLGRSDEETLFRAGTRIETTLDLDMQRAAERAVAGTLGRRKDPEAALVALDVSTGGVLAMVGGRDHSASVFNLATQGRRQPGSAMKPVVLAQALREGMSLGTRYPAPRTVQVGDWRVSNYGRRGYGTLDLGRATTSSVNTVYAQLIADVGPGDVAKLGRRMGIESPLEPTAALALGVSPVSPLELTTAYATLASGGVRREPYAVTRALRISGADRVLGRASRGKRALPAPVARQVTEVLRGVVAHGTGRRAFVPGAVVAGKTGTTDDHADAWFCGYTEQIAACVWVGYAKGRIPMDDVRRQPVTGGSIPARIWGAFMQDAIRFYEGPSSKDGPGGATTWSTGGGHVPQKADRGGKNKRPSGSAGTTEPAGPPAPSPPPPSPQPSQPPGPIPSIIPTIPPPGGG